MGETRMRKTREGSSETHETQERCKRRERHETFKEGKKDTGGTKNT